jgi:hypothetical protein
MIVIHIITSVFNYYSLFFSLCFRMNSSFIMLNLGM